MTTDIISDSKEKDINEQIIPNDSIVSQFCTCIKEINQQNECGWTPLYRSIIAGNLKATEELINFGANVNVQCNMGETPLYQAVDMVKIDHVKLLLKYKSDPNISQSDGLTPLHQAVNKQNVPIVECLLSNGANSNLKNKFFEMTPVHFAIKCNVNPTILLLLVQYNGSLVVKDKNEKRPIDYVNSDEMRETLKKLRLQKEDIFRTPSKDRPVSFSTPSKMLTIANNLAYNSQTESLKKDFDLHGNTNTQDAGTSLFHFIELNRKNIFQKQSVSDVKRRNDMNKVKRDLFQSGTDRDALPKGSSDRDIEENNKLKTNSYVLNENLVPETYRGHLNILHQYYTTEKKAKIYSPIKEMKEEEYYHDTDPNKSIPIKTRKSIINKDNEIADSDSIHLISHNINLFNELNKENVNTFNIINLQSNYNDQLQGQYQSNNTNSNHNTVVQFPLHQSNSFSVLSPRLSNKNTNPFSRNRNNNIFINNNHRTSPVNSHNNYSSSNDVLTSKQLVPKKIESMYSNYSNDDRKERYTTLDSSKLYDWLCSIELQCYFPLFIDKGIYSIDQMILDMKNEVIRLTYGDVEALGIKKPGHIYRILIKMEIDAELINKRIADYICPFSYSNFKSSNIRISKEYLCCCGMSREKITNKHSPHFDLIGWLKSIHLVHLRDNFEFNGFELIQYFIIQMFSSVPIDDDIITNSLHIYNEKERDLIIMELNRNVRYVLKRINFQFTSLEMIGEREETNCHICSIF